MDRLQALITQNKLNGPIAQLGARLNGIEKAGGSNPPGSTNKASTQTLF